MQYSSASIRLLECMYTEWLMIHCPHDYHPLGLERDNEESYMIACTNITCWFCLMTCSDCKKKACIIVSLHQRKTSGLPNKTNEHVNILVSYCEVIIKSESTESAYN